MHPARKKSAARSRLQPLVAAVTMALCAGATPASAESARAQWQRVGRHPSGARLFGRTAAPAALPYVVQTCDDPLPVPDTCAAAVDGTLRQAFLCANNGDEIDLTQLQCSKITLSAPLISDAASLTLNGPGQEKLTIDGGGQSRIFVHHGGTYDALYINHLTIANGHYEKTYAAGVGGGCIYSSSYVFLNFSTVTSCYVSASQTDAAGGAIHAKRGVGLYRSTVSGSTAQGKGYSFGVGGGIYANAVELDQSTVSGNSASSAMSVGIGGGVYAQTIFANRSTISGNKASNVAGIVGVKVYLTDSTVSGNRTPTDGFVGGVYAQSVARIISSTIARNSSGGTAAAGLFVPNPAIATVTVQSTIIADNETAGVELDVGTNDGKTISGQRNLIMTHQGGTTVPADTLTADPLFTLLRDNGGPTQTHALLPGSPAIDHGSNVGGFAFDQRGRLRAIGAFTDIGAYEFDPDSIFTTGFGP